MQNGGMRWVHAANIGGVRNFSKLGGVRKLSVVRCVPRDRAEGAARCPFDSVLSHRGGLCARLPDGHSLFPQTGKGEATLFERVGGRKCLHATLQELYTRLHADPAIQKMFIRNFDKEVHAQTCFWTEMLGGPRDWTNTPNDYAEKYGVHAVNYTSMLNRHSLTLLITPEHAECWLAHLRAAAAKCIPDSQAAAALLAHATPLARALVNHPTTGPRPGEKLFDCHRATEYKDGTKLSGTHRKAECPCFVPGTVQPDNC